jgi:hypothetical protein
MRLVEVMIDREAGERYPADGFPAVVCTRLLGDWLDAARVTVSRGGDDRIAGSADSAHGVLRRVR